MHVGNSLHCSKIGTWNFPIFDHEMRFRFSQYSICQEELDLLNCLSGYLPETVNKVRSEYLLYKLQVLNNHTNFTDGLCTIEMAQPPYHTGIFGYEPPAIGIVLKRLDFEVTKMCFIRWILRVPWTEHVRNKGTERLNETNGQN